MLNALKIIALSLVMTFAMTATADNPNYNPEHCYSLQALYSSMQEWFINNCLVGEGNPIHPDCYFVEAQMLSVYAGMEIYCVE